MLRRMRVIGLMSGTSADGIDAALVEWPDGSGAKPFRLLAHVEARFEREFQARVHQLAAGRIAGAEALARFGDPLPDDVLEKRGLLGRFGVLDVPLLLETGGEERVAHGSASPDGGDEAADFANEVFEMKRLRQHLGVLQRPVAVAEAVVLFQIDRAFRQAVAAQIVGRTHDDQSCGGEAAHDQT